MILYHTSGCHLCELAIELLDLQACHYELVDIALDEALVAQYGLRIPVLVRGDGAELSWPFAASDLSDFVVVGNYFSSS